MNNLQQLLTTYPGIYITIVIWEFIWKGISLWLSARNKRFYWFIAILIFNTVGIIPIIYLIIHHRKEIGKFASKTILSFKIKI